MLNLSLQTEISDMGNKESKEQQLFIGVILQLLNKRGIKVKKASVQSFFTFVQEQCPWFPEEGTVNSDTWEKVGKQLKTYYTLHGPERVPTDTFPLWNMIRDALDPAHESERVPIKEESEEEESKPSYRQLRSMLAAMNTNSHLESGDEKEEQLSPQDEKDLEEAAARYHSDEDWSFSAKDAPKGLRETSPIRPFVRSKQQTVKSPEQEKRNMGCSHPPIPPPPYEGKGPPLGVSQRRVFSSPEDEFGPHLEACFSVIFEERDGRDVPSWEPLSMKLIKELKQACALYGATAPYTLTLLDALAARWMIPYDWKTVAKACLSGGHIYSRELNMRTSPESRLVLTADMARGTLYKKCWRELMNLIQLEIRWV